jgi:hypothetical protein
VKVRTLGALTIAIVLGPVVAFPQSAPPRDRAATQRLQALRVSAAAKGQFNISRMPPGEYVRLAVKGVQPGEEWDPALRKRIEQLGKRFTLKEGETLQLDMPYVEE